MNEKNDYINQEMKDLFLINNRFNILFHLNKRNFSVNYKSYAKKIFDVYINQRNMNKCYHQTIRTDSKNLIIKETILIVTKS